MLYGGGSGRAPACFRPRILFILGFVNIYRDHIFPVCNDFITRRFVRHRKRLLESASGTVLEIGFGSGLSLDDYPENILQVVGLEPNPGMRRRAETRLQKASLKNVKLVEGAAEAVPFGDGTFDTVVSFLTLCSVNDLAGAILEIKRVLKDGGKFLFI